jgi:hypothetical protein
MKKEDKTVKVIYARVPLDMFTFLKTHSWTLGETMNSVIIGCLEKYRKQVESKNSKG